MDSIEKAAEKLEQRIGHMEGITGFGVVDYGDGEQHIEVGVTTFQAHKLIEEICQEEYFKNYHITVILPGKTSFLRQP